MASAEHQPLIDSETQISMSSEQALREDRTCFDTELMTEQAQSPAYKILHQHKLITSRYRVKTVHDLKFIEANSTIVRNTVVRGLLWTAGCIPGCIDGIFNRQFLVPEGCIRMGDDGNGRYLMFGPGAHRIRSPFYNIDPRNVKITSPVIQHGTETIITVPQGQVGLAFDRGQPVLFPPGLHQWDSETLKFEKCIDLCQPVIEMGPYTLLTVDEGYAAVTQNNGAQEILDGGSVYMLTHRNWRFEKFLTCKIQTNDLKRVRCTTADNIILETSANVIWIIADVAKAAKMAVQTMRYDGTAIHGEDIQKLRENVLQQALSSLAAFIGKVRYSDSGMDCSLEAGDQASRGMGGAGFLFDPTKLETTVEHGNTVCEQYGVKIISINIVSAIPVDVKLMNALAAGAVAAAEAEMAEISAKGRSKAMTIDAQASADAQRVRAKGEADAEMMIAEGMRTAAEKLADSEVAVKLTEIEKTGKVLDGKKTFFFGASANAMNGLLINPNIVN